MECKQQNEEKVYVECRLYVKLYGNIGWSWLGFWRVADVKE